MSRILIIADGQTGHVNPLIGLVQRLIVQGHRVGWICRRGPTGIRVRLARLGVDVLGPSEATLTVEAHQMRDECQLSDVQQLRAQTEDQLRTLAARAESLRPLIEAFQPDVVALDNLTLAGAVAVSQLRIPFAVLFTNLGVLAPDEVRSPVSEVLRATLDSKRRVLQELGVEATFSPSGSLLSPKLNVVFATAALVGEATLPAPLLLAGPSLPIDRRDDEPDFPWHRLQPKRSLVYASFGSVLDEPTLSAKVAEAAQANGAQLVLRSDHPLEGHPEALTVSYAPQLPLLKRAAAFVTHGGANSVMEALTFGVPLLLIPLTTDQPVQAYFVERAGVGRVVDARTASVESLTADLAALLSDASGYRARAAAVSESYRESDGAQATAEALVALTH